MKTEPDYGHGLEPDRPQGLRVPAGARRVHGRRELPIMAAALGDGVMFLPIAITWFEIAKAFRAFGRLPAQHSDFLSEWQGGFRGKSTPISGVASIVAVTIVAVAVVYVFLSYFERRGSVRIGVAEPRDDDVSELSRVSAEYAREMRQTLDRLPIIASTAESGSGSTDVGSRQSYSGERADRRLVEQLVGVMVPLNSSASAQVEVLKEIREVLIDLQVKLEGLG
jgi:hypothetical protein